CAHHPPVQIPSSRPSPLSSPVPRPCENLRVPGTSLPGSLGTLIGCISHSCVGSGPGRNQAICPWSSLPGGCQPMTRTRRPLPNRSTYCGVSLQALGQITCSFLCPVWPVVFWYQ